MPEPSSRWPSKRQRRVLTGAVILAAGATLVLAWELTFGPPAPARSMPEPSDRGARPDRVGRNNETHRPDASVLDEFGREEDLQGAAAANRGLGELKTLQDRIDQASSVTPEHVRRAARIVERYPRLADARLMLARLHYQRGNFDRAREQVRFTLDLDPRYASAQALAGDLAFRQDEPETALSHFQHAADLKPSEPEYLIQLGHLQTDLNKLDDARMSFLKALRLSPEQARAHAGLAEVFARQNRIDMAIQSLDRASEHSGRASRILHAMRKAQLLRRDNRHENALATLEQLEVTEPFALEVLEQMAICLAMAGRPEAAARRYEQALKQTPDDWRLIAGAARWRLRAEQPEKARPLLKRLFQIAPEEARPALRREFGPPPNE